MSRNPNKKRCQVPDCHNWAMRGHTHCRVHLEAELGPCGGGAPAGNLNALKTGHDAHPFDPTGLDQLAQHLAFDPQRLPAHLERAIDSIHVRTGDPVKTLIALQAVLDQLLPLVAQELFLAQLKVLLRQIPHRHHSAFQTILWKHALPMGPQERLRLLRATAARWERQFGDDTAPIPVIDPDEAPHLFSSLLEASAAQPPDPHET